MVRSPVRCHLLIVSSVCFPKELQRVVHPGTQGHLDTQASSDALKSNPSCHWHRSSPSIVRFHLGWCASGACYLDTIPSYTMYFFHVQRFPAYFFYVDRR